MRFFTLLPVAILLLGTSPDKAIDRYQFISPKPGSIGNSLESTIIIRDGRPIRSGAVSQSAVAVMGSRSGPVAGNLILSEDGKTLIFRPDQPFVPGETVDVTIEPLIVTEGGAPLGAANFDFDVSPLPETPNPYAYLPELRPDFADFKPKSQRVETVASELPEDFPPIFVGTHDSAAVGEGYIFLAVASEVEGVGYYLMMLNDDGSPFFYRELENDYAYDFKMQPNGLLTYAHFFEHHSYTGGGNVVHMIMDDSFTVVDSVQMGNGYVAEAHDFQMLPNGHFLLFGYYLTPVDMSQIVEGGRPDALVSGGIVQELDADKNVVFQWRSWDYYSFEDWPFTGRTATAAVVSEFHLNTINLDDDGHMFLGTPSWVKKINRQTGDVIWNLGGHDNEFTFVNVDSVDGVGMVAGHTFHRVPSGNVLLYDNGNRQGTRSSRVNEFRLDEQNRTVELVWSYEPNTPVAGWHRGSAQRLANGNTVIGWGGSSGTPSPAMTEVNAAGEIVHELFFDPPDIESYRAFRFPFTGGAPAASVIVTEVAPGNTYEFSAGDTIVTGISIEISALSGSGYNELTVERYDYAPVKPVFPGKPPRVQPDRMVLSSSGITSIDAEVQFDVEHWDVKHPENVVVYHREFEGQGLFVSLSTSYNPAKRIITANFNRVGEFILTVPDFESVVYTPLPLAPPDSETVNQALPVTLEWTPVGYVSTYDLQVASDEAFVDLIVDEEFLWEARFVLSDIADGSSYYWRVRATNDAGTSEWTKAQMFSTVAPFIDLIEPAGGEELTRGLDFYIRWADNIEEDVVLELHLHDALIDTIATTASDGAYEWEIDPGLAPGEGYWIKIFSSLDGSIVDSNAEPFSIVTTTAIEDDGSATIPVSHALHQSYPNPFNPAATIVFELPIAEQVSLTVYDVGGRRVATLINEFRNAGVHEASFDASHLPSAIYLYRLETPSFSRTGKMVVMR